MPSSLCLSVWLDESAVPQLHWRPSAWAERKEGLGVFVMQIMGRNNCFELPKPRALQGFAFFHSNVF